MLQEIDLIIGSFDKLRTVCRYFHAALRAGAEGRIGHNHLEHPVGSVDQRILIDDRALVYADVVQIEVHRRQRDNKIGIVRAEQCVVLQKLLFFHVAALGAHVLVCGEKEPGSAATGIRHGLRDLRIDYIDDRGDKRTGREILTSAALFVGTVFLEDLLIDCALEVALHHVPVVLGHHIDDLFQHHGAIDLICGLGKYRADQTICLRELL